VKKRSQEPPGAQQQFDSACAGCPGPDGSNTGSSPGLGIGELSLLSRGGFTSHRGKLDSELPRVRCHSETVAMLQLRAAEHGVPLSEFVRLVLECVAFGTDAVANSEAERIRRVGQFVGASAPRPPGGR
jgi:hypothetical protein